MVQGVTVDRFAIGYSGIGYATAGVRAVPLAEKEGGKCYEADPDNAYAGSYPLSRFLYVYINQAPGKPLDPLTREFIKLVLSKEGQEVVIKDGYFPIPASISKEELRQDPVSGDQLRDASRDGDAAPPARPLTSPGPARAAASCSTASRPAWSSSAALIIIASILAILLVIAAEVYPLFVKPTATFVRAYPPDRSAAAPAAVPTRSAWTSIEKSPSRSPRNGALALTALDGNDHCPPWPHRACGAATITTVAAAWTRVRYLLGTSDGRVIPLDVKFEIAFTPAGAR